MSAIGEILPDVTSSSISIKCLITYQRPLATSWIKEVRWSLFSEDYSDSWRHCLRDATNVFTLPIFVDKGGAKLSIFMGQLELSAI